MAILAHEGRTMLLIDCCERLPFEAYLKREMLLKARRDIRFPQKECGGIEQKQVAKLDPVVDGQGLSSTSRYHREQTARQQKYMF